MFDQRHFDFPSDDFTPQPSGVNRIFRFEAASEFESEELDLGAFAPIEEIFDSRLETQLEGVDVAHRLWLPEGFEPSYAYPLLVWFHDDGEDEDQLADVMPRISERNYVGLSLRGNLPRSIGCGWSTAAERWSRLANDLATVVSALEDRILIHESRKYLAGVGLGGSLAWEILLRQPRDWAGAVCLAGQFPNFPHPLANFRQLRERRLLLATGLDCPADQVQQLIDSGRLMYSAGMQVGTRMYDTGRRRPSDKMLRDVDRWIMDSIATAIR